MDLIDIISNRINKCDITKNITGKFDGWDQGGGGGGGAHSRFTVYV